VILEGRYRLVSLLGRGGVGSVFLGEDLQIQRQVAVKFLLQSGREDVRRRFQREAEVTARIRDPHVIGIHGAGVFGSHDYLVYELVEGGTSLQDAFDSLGREERLDLVEQVAAGIAAAHALGVVHRDLKPENVLIRPSGEAVVADFGLAGLNESSLTNTGQVMGTPAYMSPEQVRGEDTSPACDVWSLGLLLFEACFQRHALLEEGMTIQLLLARIFAAKIEVPRDASAGLRALIKACLQGDPAARPQDAREFLVALRAARAGGSVRGASRLPVLALLTLGAISMAWFASTRLAPEATPPRAAATSGPTVASPAVSSTAGPLGRPTASAAPRPSAPPTTTELRRPLFVLNLSRLLPRQTHFVSDEEVLFCGRNRKAQLYSLAARVPEALSPIWELAPTERSCLVAGLGPRLVLVSKREAWTVTLPGRERTPLPSLPFAPSWVALWLRGQELYLGVARAGRIAAGPVGQPLRELSCEDYELKGLAGGGDHVVAIVRSTADDAPGILVFPLGGGAEPAFHAFATRPTALVLASGGARAFVGSRIGILKVWSGPIPGEVTRLGVGHEGSLRGLDWQSGRLVAVSKLSVSVWRDDELRAPIYRGAIPGPTKAETVTLSPSGERLLVRRGREVLGWRLRR
jgi:eukaryotic-like serine/threonine-protein kinase